MTKAKLRHNRARIYYGTNKTKLFWTVKVSDAKVPVKLNGSLMDAIKGTPGQTIGCHLSNCALRNQDSFPHAVHFAAFTGTRALIVDKIVNGQPVHAVRYVHGYSDLVDLNDTDRTKKTVKAAPHLAERKFTLGVPEPYRGREAGRPKGKNTGARKPTVPHGAHGLVKGALRRAQRAGLVTADLVSALR